MGGVIFHLPENYVSAVDMGYVGSQYDERFSAYKHSFDNPSDSSSLVIIEVFPHISSLSTIRNILDPSGTEFSSVQKGNYYGQYRIDNDWWMGYYFEKDGKMITITVGPENNIDIAKIIS